MPPPSVSTSSSANSEETFIVSRLARSIRMFDTSGGCTDRSTPAMRSALFSVSASSWATESDAFSDSVWTDTPRTCRLRRASACTEMNNEALARLAKATLSRSGTKTSESRVISTR